MKKIHEDKEEKQIEKKKYTLERLFRAFSGLPGMCKICDSVKACKTSRDDQF